MIILGNTQIHKYANHCCEGFYLYSPLQPSFVYLFGPKTVFVGESTDKHYKMTIFLFVYLIFLFVAHIIPPPRTFICAACKAVISLVQKQIHKYAKEPLGTFCLDGVFCIFRRRLMIWFVTQIRK